MLFQNDLSLITTLPFYEKLSDSEVKALNGIATPLLIKENSDLPISHASDDSTFYLVLRGHLIQSVSKNYGWNPIRICGPGEVIGFDGEEQKAETIDEVYAWRFSRSEFQDLFQRTPNLQNAFLACLCYQIKKSNERIVALENHSVGNRVASLLVSLIQKFGKQIDGGFLLDLKIQRETMARLAGTVIESFSRQLSELENQGILERHGRSIFIRDFSGLIDKTQI